MPPAAKLCGERFGSLLVKQRAGSNTLGVLWSCACDCGGTIFARTSALRSGNTRSCGCYQRTHAVRHGSSGTPTYKSWAAMLARCRNENHQAFADYGGRGVAVCERWQRFENFLADMGKRPSGRTLDRIDVDGNYEPTNCRWATPAEQRRNQRQAKIREQDVYEIRMAITAGETQTRIAKRFGVDPSTISHIASGRSWRAS